MRHFLEVVPILSRPCVNLFLPPRYSFNLLKLNFGDFLSIISTYYYCSANWDILLFCDFCKTLRSRRQSLVLLNRLRPTYSQLEPALSEVKRDFSSKVKTKFYLRLHFGSVLFSWIGRTSFKFLFPS